MSEVLTLGIAGFALALGFKHSFDADHVVAVSTYLTRTRNVSSAVRMGFHWAVGHMVTAALLTFLLFTFKDVFLSSYLGGLESLVAIMLIGVGFLAFKDMRAHRHSHMHGGVKHTHPHLHSGSGKTAGNERISSHPGADHGHRHMFGIGIVHGLASNDELLLLLVAQMGLSSLFGMFVGVLLFSVGVVGGMTVFSILVNYPIRKWGSRIQAALIGGSGLLSIIYGSVLLLGI